VLDESRRDDISWLVASYDQLVEPLSSEDRDADLALVQKWLCFRQCKRPPSHWRAWLSAESRHDCLTLLRHYPIWFHFCVEVVGAGLLFVTA
jgi:hypothetical protein